MKKVLFLFFLFPIAIVAQEKRLYQEVPDSIQSLKFFELYKLYLDHQKKDPVKAHTYANAYLKKAKNEKNTFFIAHGLILAADIYKKEEIFLTYMDSVTQLTEAKNSKEFPARGYLLRGDYFYRKQMFSNALTNYKLASQFAMQKTNPKIIYESNRSIGLINSSLGMHKRALELFRESYEYAVKEEMDSKLKDLYFLSYEFNKLKLLDSASYFNVIGIEKSLKMDNKTLYHYFTLNSGITNYYKREYQKAIDSINKVLPYLERNGSTFDLIEPYLYLGKTYDKLNEKNKSVFFLKKWIL